MSGEEIAGRYRLEELTAHGGMSEVWRAADLNLERTVAVKLLAPAADQARFEREARAVASLSHPNIVQLYDYGETDDRPYMVLEWCGGGTLEGRLTSEPLPDGETQRIAGEVAAGLAAAHAAGIVHRDLKPANVLFDGEDRAKLADFGIARTAVGEGTLTEAGTVLGTASYISPEQAGGETATAASDVYSFGVLLYRMLTGRLPFEGDAPVQVALQHRQDEPPPIERVRPDAPPALAALATAALAKDPAARPADGAALLAALGGATAFAAADDATRIIPPTSATVAAAAVPPPSRRSRRTPVVAVAALLVLLIAGVAFAYELTKSPSPQPAAAVTTTQSTHRTRTHATTTAPTTTAATSSQQTTTRQTTTHAATTARQATTRAATTRPATTAAPPPPPPPTTTPATTTTPTTTAATTTAATTTTPPPPPTP